MIALDGAMFWTCYQDWCWFGIYGYQPTASDESVNPRVKTMAQAHDCLLLMGITSEYVSQRFGVTRKEQDRVADHFNICRWVMSRSSNIAYHVRCTTTWWFWSWTRTCWVMLRCGLDNIRKTSFFQRDPRKLEP